MKRVNQILRRVYALYPAIGAWMVSSQSSSWGDAIEAMSELGKYVGPHANDHILETHHIRGPDDRDFIRSTTTWEAINEAVHARYRGELDSKGFLSEEAPSR